MKRGKRESGFADGVVLVAAICGALIAIGLLVPASRPLAFQIGTALSLAFIVAGIGVGVYAAWRILTFPYRRRRALARGSRQSGV